MYTVRRGRANLDSSAVVATLISPRSLLTIPLRQDRYGRPTDERSLSIGEKKRRQRIDSWRQFYANDPISTWRVADTA